MAKGGSGDLLTGLIAGLLAQYPSDAARAVEAAVYLHGLAADLAVREGDEHTLLATDSLGQLGRVFRFRVRGGERICLVAGAAGGCVTGGGLARGIAMSDVDTTAAGQDARIYHRERRGHD